jgi:hypothetical protein
MFQVEITNFESKAATRNLCGRLVRWDAGTLQEELMISEADFCHARMTLDAFDKIKSFSTICDPSQPNFNSVCAIKKVLKILPSRRPSRQEARKHCGRLSLGNGESYCEKFVRLPVKR